MKKIFVKKLSEDEIRQKGIYSWPIWTSEISEFPWEYSQQESCYLLEGEVEVITDTETVKIGKGDYVVFPEGLECRWKVLKPVRKHYSFG